MIKLKTNDWILDNIETILFDKDGTFIDLHFFWGKMTELRVKSIIKNFNIEQSLFSELCLILGYDTQKKRMLSDGITALYSRVKIIQIFTEKLRKYNIFTTEVEIEKIFNDVNTIFYKEIHNYTKPIEEAIDFIKKLDKKNIKLGIVTSDSVESTNLTLNNFNWNNLFQCVVGRESSIETKESGALTKIALKELNANPETTIMIGDAPMDYISAKNAKIERTILVASGQINTNELTKISKYTVNSLAEIEIE